MRSHSKLLPNFFVVFALLASVLGSALMVTPVYAAGITVNTTRDELNSDGDCSLREAIQAANTDTAVDACTAGSGADAILVRAGTYTLTILGAGENANAKGDLDITEALTIRGASAGSTVIQAATRSGFGIDRVFHVMPAISVSISKVTIANGKVSGGGGGIENFGILIVTNSTFSGNSARDGGGGVYNESTLTVTNSTFSGNSAELGGGINSFGTLTVTNSTFSGNSALLGGGSFNDGGTLTVTNSTFSGNSADGESGGIHNLGTLRLKNTILANSSAGGGDCFNGSIGTISMDINNLIETNGPSGNECGTPDVTADPKLGALTGSPAYFPLKSGSPAINAGDDAVCAAAPVNNTSQGGVTRPRGAHCEIGSFEFAPSTTAITSDLPDPSRLDQAVIVTATVSGGTTPTGSVAITGADTNCTITLSGGTGSCMVNFASQGLKTLTATYNGDGAHNPSSDTEGHIAALVENFHSNAANDGWILESGENTNVGGTLDSTATTLRMGDDASDRQFRSILSFNTASLPDNAVIASVMLQTTLQNSTGDPNFADFGGRSFVDVKNPTFGAASLELTDFNASPTVIAGGHQTTPVNGNLYRAFFNADSLSSIDLGGLTQIRIRFKLDDDNDNAADFFSFFSGNAAAAADRPLLQIMYYTP